MKLQDINKFPLFKTMPSLGVFSISTSKAGYPNELSCKDKFTKADVAAYGKGQEASELIKRSVDILARNHKDFRGDLYSYFRSRATNDMELMIFHGKSNNPDTVKEIMKNYKLDKNTKKMIENIVGLNY